MRINSTWKTIDLSSALLVILGVIVIFFGKNNWWIGILMGIAGIIKQSLYNENEKL